MTEAPRNHLSIDIGGTKIRTVCYTPNFEIIEDQRLETPDFFQKRGIVDLHNLFAAIPQYLHTQTFDRLGISMNCVMHQDQVVYSSLLNGGQGTKLEPIARQYFDFNRFKADNDVIAMARAELHRGVGQRTDSFLFVNLGTGLKYVYSESGKLVLGGKGSAGEVSQNPIWVPELGEYIKVDDLASGKGITNFANLKNGEIITAEQAFKDSREDLIDPFIKYLAQVLKTASFHYNPHVIAFGGSLTLSADKWLDKLKSIYFNTEYPFLLADELVISSVEHPASVGAILFD